MPSATSSGAPWNSPVRASSTCSTGLKRKSKSIIGRLAVRAGADEREVREVAREAAQLAHGARAAPSRSSSGDVLAAALARGVAAVVAAAEDVAAGRVADVDVAGDPRRLERLEVAVDGLPRSAPALRASSSAVTGPVGGEQRVDAPARRVVEMRSPRARRVPSAAVGVGRGNGSAQCGKDMQGLLFRSRRSRTAWSTLSSQRPRDRIMRVAPRPGR